MKLFSKSGLSIISVLFMSIFFLISLAGCSSPATSSEDSFEDMDTIPSSQETETMEETSEDVDVGTGGSEELAEEDSDIMRFCESTKQTDLAKYEYYWTDDEYYEKVNTGNDGESLKIATVEEVCVKVLESSVEGWQCSDGSESLFQETKRTAQDMVDSPHADIYGIRCKDMEYDETIFQTD